MMKRTVLATLTLAALGIAAPAFAAASPTKPMGINAREHRQAERIKDGKADGQLTPGELDRLHADEAAIRAKEKVYRDSGGDLSKKEYKDLEKDLNKTSQEIYRFTHNGK
jgi:hypothetical protein